MRLLNKNHILHYMFRPLLVIIRCFQNCSVENAVHAFFFSYRALNTQGGRRRHATPRQTRRYDGATHPTLEEKTQAQKSPHNSFETPDDD
jgi:hypothetical protein